MTTMGEIILRYQSFKKLYKSLVYIFITHDTLKYYCDDFPKGGVPCVPNVKTATFKQEILNLSYFRSSNGNAVKKTPQNLHFLLKMSGQPTSYDKRFGYYDDFKKYHKFHQLCMEMTSSLPVIRKKVDVS